MKAILYLVVVLTNLFGAAEATPDETGALTIGIVNVANSGRVSVEVNNASAKPIRMWKDSNTWGAARWRLLVLRNGKLEGFFQNPNRAFSRNGPGFTEIPSKSHIDQNLDLNDGQWCELGHCSLPSPQELPKKKIGYNSGDVVIVVYDVPLSSEARELHVWYGTAATSITIQ